MWLLLIICAFFFSVVSYLMRKSLASKFLRHNRLINSIFYVGFLLPVGLVLYLVFGGNLNVGFENLVYLLVGSIIWPILSIVAFRANHKLDVGVFTVISSSSPVVTILISLTFLGEQITTKQFAGIVLLLVSGIIVALPLIKPNSTFGRKEVAIGFLSALILGVAIAYEKFMLTRIDFGAYIVYGWGAQILWSIWLARKDLTYLKEVARDKNLRNKILIYGSSSALKSVFFISALSITTAAIFAPTVNFLSVVILFVSYFALNEKSHLLSKILAVLVGVAGLMLISI